MTTITIKVNERTKKGKAFLEFARTFFQEGKEVSLVEDKDKKSPYDPEFIKMVLESKASKKRYRVDNVDELWESL